MYMVDLPTWKPYTSTIHDRFSYTILFGDLIFQFWTLLGKYTLGEENKVPKDIRKTYA